MKINKYFRYMAIGAAAVGFTSCNGSEHDDYQWAPVPEGQEVYFASGMATNYTLLYEETSFTVPVSRMDKSAASTVTITAVAASENTDLSNFDIPTSVSFAAGAENAEITIGYDADAIGPNNTQSIKLSISDESAVTPYGMSTITIECDVPEKWTFVGTGTYNYDDPFYDGSDEGLEFYKSNANRYKITNWGDGVDFIFAELPDGSLEVENTYIGYTHSNYGKIYVREASKVNKTLLPGKVSGVNGNTYTFAVAYYCSAGVFAGVLETFVLD